MIWNILGAIASIICIFSFFTGISTFAHLRTAWINKTTAQRRRATPDSFKPSKPSKPSEPAGLALIPRSQWVWIVAAGIIASTLVFSVPDARIPNWLPSLVKSAAFVDRIWVAGLIAIGWTFMLCLTIARWRRMSDPDPELFYMIIAFVVVSSIGEFFHRISYGVLPALGGSIIMTGIYTGTGVAVCGLSILVMIWWDARKDR